MRGTTSNRPRSPRRVLRGETLLTPRVPMDLRAAWADAVDEQYGWPNDDDHTDSVWSQGALYVDESEELFEYETVLLYTSQYDKPDTSYEYDGYDGYDEYDHEYDLHPDWRDDYRDNYEEYWDGWYQDSTMRTMDEDDAWYERRSPWWIKAAEVDYAWELHDGPLGATYPTPASRRPLAPAWDRSHPLYGMHPR